MKSSWLLVVSLLAGLSPAGAQPLPHVRTLDVASKIAFDRGLEESPRFRALLDALDRSDVIVHVVSSPSLPNGLLGTMRFVARLGATRYVRIDLATLAMPDARVATLAHELQHALELARSSVASQQAVRELYRNIGEKVPGRDSFETEAARQAGVEVWGELRSARRSARLTTEQ
jgi:hypothetical protein